MEEEEKGIQALQYHELKHSNHLVCSQSTVREGSYY